jgi:hypothetical protein
MTMADKYTKQELTSFALIIVSAFKTPTPENERSYRSELAAMSMAQFYDHIESAVRTSQFLSHEARVQVARELMRQGLPSILDVSLYLEARKPDVRRMRRIKDEADYNAVLDLLNEDDSLSTRQRQRINAMILAYEASKRTA